MAERGELLRLGEAGAGGAWRLARHANGRGRAAVAAAALDDVADEEAEEGERGAEPYAHQRADVVAVHLEAHAEGGDRERVDHRQDDPGGGAPPAGAHGFHVRRPRKSRAGLFRIPKLDRNAGWCGAGATRRGRAATAPAARGPPTRAARPGTIRETPGRHGRRNLPRTPPLRRDPVGPHRVRGAGGGAGRSLSPAGAAQRLPLATRHRRRRRPPPLHRARPDGSRLHRDPARPGRLVRRAGAHAGRVLRRARPGSDRPGRQRQRRGDRAALRGAAPRAAAHADAHQLRHARQLAAGGGQADHRSGPQRSAHPGRAADARGPGLRALPRRPGRGLRGPVGPDRRGDPRLPGATRRHARAHRERAPLLAVVRLRADGGDRAGAPPAAGADARRVGPGRRVLRRALGPLAPRRDPRYDARGRGARGEAVLPRRSARGADRAAARAVDQPDTEEGGMNAKQLGLSVVLIGFAGLNAYVVYEYGYVGFLRLVLANAATVAALVDLTIALSLVTLWMWQDSRERGIGFVPYVILTLTLGSIGPLCYLIRRESTVPARAFGATARAS